MTARIDRLWPDAADALSDEELLGMHAFPVGEGLLRMNFVSSVDGAATRAGLSGGLGDAADRRLFDLLRRLADTVLVAAGTVRDEEYGAMRMGDASARWREERGMPAHPVFALVSRSLDLDPASSVFTDAPVRPVVYTVRDAPERRRAALAAVADVVTAGVADLDAQVMRADLRARGLRRIHCEGGPSLFGALLADGVVDELCLTVAPTLEGGPATRIATAPDGSPTRMRLLSVLRAHDELLLRYARDRA